MNQTLQGDQTHQTDQDDQTDHWPDWPDWPDKYLFPPDRIQEGWCENCQIWEISVSMSEPARYDQRCKRCWHIWKYGFMKSGKITPQCQYFHFLFWKRTGDCLLPLYAKITETEQLRSHSNSSRLPLALPLQLFMQSSNSATFLLDKGKKANIIF